MKVPTDLFGRIAEILDDDSEMHDGDCASVMGPPGPFFCDCQRDKKIVKIVLMISRLLKGK